MTPRAVREPLSRERVLGAAVAIADAEGLKALTMRRLAADLDVEAMSLYYHLPAKEALLDGVVETVLAEVLATVSTAGDSGHWRERLRGRFLAARQVMLRHPWAPGLLGTRKSVPAIIYAYYDGIVATMVGAGFSYRLAHRALHSFGSMTLGFVQEIFSPADGFEEDTSEDELAAMAEAVPNLTAMIASEVHAAGDPMLGWCDSQVEFEFTLDLLLDGLERLRT
ncbi:TetR/AcrR family transcriptional regulator C-terminal domain-containing protein [Actinoplanes sp. NPDC051861]|uniref:TetR/AcrR family transcriptional regulator C-terminal domain-containing protein n=1 Tax=Actinoplanes sp. NPDC051861 TaxID=3155170 RepID=UPI00342564DF